MVHLILVCYYYYILFACYDKPPSSFAVMLVYSLNSSSVFKVSSGLSLPHALPYNQLLLLFNFLSCTSVVQFSCAITLFSRAVTLFMLLHCAVVLLRCLFMLLRCSDVLLLCKPMRLQLDVQVGNKS